MDLQYLVWLQNLREGLGGALDGLFVLISSLGEATLPLILAFGLYWCIDKRAGQYLLFTCNVGDFLCGLLKLTFCTYRPWVRNGAIMPVQGALHGATGYSFPSGHASKAVCAYGGLAILYQKKRWAVIGLGVLVLLILFSRNYLGVHTPQDVIVGAALGAMVLWLISAFFKWADGGKNRDVLALCAGVAICAAAVLFCALKTYPLDYDVNGALLVDPADMQPDTFSAAGAALGLLFGWTLERRRIRFLTDCSLLTKALRFVSGVAILIAIFYVVRPMLCTFMGANWSTLAGAALATFYGTALHPYIFTKIERAISAAKTSADSNGHGKAL